jgi:hypothetical protein
MISSGLYPLARSAPAFQFVTLPLDVEHENCVVRYAVDQQLEAAFAAFKLLSTARRRLISICCFTNPASARSVSHFLAQRRARLEIDDAQRPQNITSVRSKRRSSIKTYSRLTGYKRVGFEAVITRRVGDNEQLIALKCVGAEGNLARRLPVRHTHRCLEELPLGIDQGHRRDRGPEDPRRQRDNSIKLFFAWRIEKTVLGEHLQPPVFVERITCINHCINHFG